MASAVPYDPEGLEAESNPFAQENPSLESPTTPQVPTGAPSEEYENEPPRNQDQNIPAAAAPVPAPVKPVKKYKLVLKITALERQGKKDPIFRFDAYVC